MATTKVVDVIGVSPYTSSRSADSSAREYSTTLSLTFFDTFWLKFPPVERLYFYQVDDLTRHLFQSVVLPRLTASLSLALLHHLPLSGKIRWPPAAPKPDVYYYPDDSLSVTVAESDADFDCLSGDQIHEANDLRPLTPELSTSDDLADLIAVQITLFPNKGFSIGVSTHHAI